jgi:hypothetical protein
VGARGVGLGLATPVCDVLAVDRQPLDRRSNRPRTRADGARPLCERADRLQLPCDERVAAFELGGLGEERGGVIGCHASILAARGRGE